MTAAAIARVMVAAVTAAGRPRRDGLTDGRDGRAVTGSSTAVTAVTAVTSSRRGGRRLAGIRVLDIDVGSSPGPHPAVLGS